MKIADFKVEQWMNAYEGKAVFNMTDTCVSPFTYEQLTAMDTQHLLSMVKLDYGTITGDVRVKKEILKMYSTGVMDQITLAQGCLQANEMVMETLLEPGDHVLVYTPSYQQFSEYPKSLGCIVTELELHEENQWQASIAALRNAFKENIDLVILNNPNNPTGTVFAPAYLSELFTLCKKQGTYILCDEVYRDPSIPSISDLYEKGIATSSLSKMFSLAGLRFGWIKGPQEIIDAVNVRRDYSIISTGPLADTLALIALQHASEILQRSRAIINQNKQFLRTWLLQNPSFHFIMPDVGTVGFLKYDAGIPSVEFAKGILQQYGVFYVPGSCFNCEQHLRLGLTANAEQFQKGLQLTADYLKK